MKVYNTNEKKLNIALSKVNDKYNGNVIWNRSPELISKRNNGYRLTLRVKSSDEKGARISTIGHRMVSACWHVHGDFFDILFNEGVEKILCGYDPETKQIRTMNDKQDNWNDWVVGNEWIGQHMASELCRCN